MTSNEMFRRARSSWYSWRASGCVARSLSVSTRWWGMRNALSTPRTSITTGAAVTSARARVTVAASVSSEDIRLLEATSGFSASDTRPPPPEAPLAEAGRRRRARVAHAPREPPPHDPLGQLRLAAQRLVAARQGPQRPQGQPGERRRRSLGRHEALQGPALGPAQAASAADQRGLCQDGSGDVSVEVGGAPLDRRLAH